MMEFPETTSPDERATSGVRAVDYDAELQLHDRAFRRACAIHAHERVLDIGCGAGKTTRDAARAASAGSALGIDISAPMIARARELAAAEDVRNVRFEHGDAQTHPLPAQGFDVAISRFGTMFFADAPAAFANLARACRPGARLVMMVWQSHERNEWTTAIHEALRSGEPLTAAPAFSLGDPAAVEALLAGAGFGEVGFTDVNEPVYYGPDAEFAYEIVTSWTGNQDSAPRARERLRALLAAHQTGEGVLFGSRAWIVTATRQRHS